MINDNILEHDWDTAAFQFSHESFYLDELGRETVRLLLVREDVLHILLDNLKWDPELEANGSK